jgi:U3 small nucleolar RNA-associated protein 21
MSSSSTRSKDWDDVLTAHADEMCVRSWTVLNKRLGKHTFSSAESSKRKAPSGVVKVHRFSPCFSPALIFIQCVCVTACGNFGLAGSSAGEIHMWNLQSGLKRKSFKVGPCPRAVIDRLESSSMAKPKASERAITGLASDALNRVVIASTSDGTVNVSLHVASFVSVSRCLMISVFQFPHVYSGPNDGFTSFSYFNDITARFWITRCRL